MEPPPPDVPKASAPEQERATRSVRRKGRFASTTEPQAKVIAAWLVFLAAILVPIVNYLVRDPPPRPIPTPEQERTKAVSEHALQIVGTAYRRALGHSFLTRGWDPKEFAEVLTSISACSADVQMRYVAFINVGDAASSATLGKLRAALAALVGALKALQPVIGDVSVLSTPTGFAMMQRAETLRLEVNRLFETFANQTNVALPALPNED